jgi:hypothetical protein
MILLDYIHFFHYWNTIAKKPLLAHKSNHQYTPLRGVARAIFLKDDELVVGFGQQPKHANTLCGCYG